MTLNEHDEKEAARLFNLFQNQSGMIQNDTNRRMNEFDNQGGDFGEYGDGNSIGLGFDNQNPSNESNIELPPMKKKIIPSTNSSPNNNTSDVVLPTNMDICPFCKTIHPPLRPGEKCPNAGLDNKDKKKFSISDEIINKHIITLKNIIINNMSSKNISNGTKFFQYAILELSKALESYEE